MKKAGMDNGNYALKLWVGGKEQAIQIPSIISLHTGESSNLFEVPDVPKNKLIDNIDVTIYSKALDKNGERYYVGNKVIIEGEVPEELENHSDKSTDKITAILGLSGLAINEIYDNYDKDEIKVTYDISVSLPINTINFEKANAYASRFIGTHEIIFHHPSGRNQKVVLEIVFARTLPEGSAGSWGIIYNEDGTLKEWTLEEGNGQTRKSLENDTLLHFDIGAGTTEQVVTEGVVYNPRQSYGHDFGVKQTIQSIRNQWNHINTKANEKIDSVAEFNNIYFDKENPRNAKLIELSKPHFQKLANTMSKIIINKIDELKTKPVVFIYGGGSIILEPYLREELTGKDRMDRVVFLNDPIYVTAKGLLVYTSSPRYESHKQKMLGVVESGS